MQPDRWHDLLDQVREKFKVEDEGKEHSEEYGGSQLEFVIFDGPLGRVKLEFITKPKVVDKKLTYSNRIGSDVEIDYIYSQTEKVHQFLLYRWDEAAEGWQPLDQSQFNLG
ncbi:MAG: hypothetical protein V1765_00765 [bacterium]